MVRPLEQMVTSQLDITEKLSIPTLTIISSISNNNSNNNNNNRSITHMTTTPTIPTRRSI